MRFADEVSEAPPPLAEALAEAPAGAALAEALAPAPSRRKKKKRRKPKPEDGTPRRRAKLPKGWVSVLDPTTNKKYYWHRETDTATWERPAA